MNAHDLRSQLAAGKPIRDCSFIGENIAGIDCSRAVLRLCRFDQVTGTTMTFDEARLEDSSAKAADFSNASFRNAKLSETTFERALLRQAVFDGASGEGLCFRGADLCGASLVGAHFDDADFPGADLGGADLSGGSFRGADFRGAILEGTRFGGADCTGARFDAGIDPQDHASRRTSDTETGAADPIDVGALSAALDGLSKALIADGANFAASVGSVQDGEGPPESMKSWLEPLMKNAGTSEAIDLSTLLNALSAQPGGLQNLLSESHPPSLAELLAAIQQALATLESGADPAPGQSHK